MKKRCRIFMIERITPFNNLKIIVLLVLSALLYTGCYTATLAPTEDNLRSKQLTPPPGKALVYFYLDCEGYAFIDVAASLNGIKSRISKDTYVLWEVFPGDYLLTFEDAKLEIQCEANHIYYYYVSSVSIFGEKLGQASDATGRAKINELSLVKWFKDIPAPPNTKATSEAEVAAGVAEPAERVTTKVPAQDSGDQRIDFAPTASPQVHEKPESTTSVLPVPRTSPPERFAIRDPQFEAKHEDACTTDATIISADGDSFRVEAGSRLTFLDGTLALWCHGAKHTWKDRLTYAGHVFDSDSESPLQFMVDKDKGYVYLAGKGKVTLPDGTVISLPVEHPQESAVVAGRMPGALSEKKQDDSQTTLQADHAITHPDQVNKPESDEGNIEPPPQKPGETKKPQLAAEVIGTIRLIVQKDSDVTATTFKDGIMTGRRAQFEYEPDADIEASLEQMGFEVIPEGSKRPEDATLVVRYQEKKRGSGLDSPTAYYFSFRLRHKTKGTILERSTKAAGCDSAEELRNDPQFRDLGGMVRKAFTQESLGRKEAQQSSVRTQQASASLAKSDRSVAQKRQTRIPLSKDHVVKIESISAIVGQGKAFFSNSDKPGMLNAGVDGTTPVVNGRSCLFCVKTITIGPNMKVPLSPFFVGRSEKGKHGGKIVESITVDNIRLTGPGATDDTTEYIQSGENGATLQKEGNGFILVEGEAYYVKKVDSKDSIAPNKTDNAIQKDPGVSDALLPPFTFPLKGSNEVRIRNPNDFSVTVGLRSGKNGKDFRVLANDSASVFVPNGKYEIYFIYSNEPDALFKGDDFSLNGNGVEIRIVKVVDGNYGIKRVKN